MKSFFTATLLILFTFAATLTGYSQSIWGKESSIEKRAGIEIMIPSFDRPKMESPSSALYLYSHLPVTDAIAIELDLPVSHLAVGDSETAIGNPYIGIQTISRSDLKFDLGLRVPLAPTDNAGSLTGILIENYKTAPFTPDVFSIISNIHYRFFNNKSGLGFRLDGGPEILFPKDGGGELFIKYGGQLLYRLEKLTVGSGIIGRLIATETNYNFKERSINNLGFTGSYDFNSISLGSYIELPLNDAESIFSPSGNWLNLIIGLKIDFNI